MRSTADLDFDHNLGLVIDIVRNALGSGDACLLTRQLELDRAGWLEQGRCQDQHGDGHCGREELPRHRGGDAFFPSFFRVVMTAGVLCRLGCIQQQRVGPVKGWKETGVDANERRTNDADDGLEEQISL